MPRIMLTWTLWATVVGSSLAQTTFTSPACTPLVLEAPLIATDLDGDGDSDIASAAGPVLQFRYTSNGISSAINEMITLPGVILRADSGDIDGDGDTDIVVHYQTSTTATGVSVIESRPTGWLRRDLSSTFFAVPGIQLLDLDGDGDLDLFIGHRTMMWNPGDGQFSSALPLFFTPSAPNAIPLTAPIGHDVDGDGDIDFVYCESIPGLPAASRLILQIYEGGSIYRRHQLFPRCDGQVPTLIWGDFDGDGDPDLAAAQEGPFGSSTGSNVGWSTRIAVFLQTSPLRFLSLTSFLTAPQTLSPAGLQQFWGEFSVGCSDVDADGFDDLLIRHRFAAGNPNQVEPAVSIMRGRPSGLLENTGLAPTPVSRGTIQFVDFDLDGHVDLLTHGLTGPANPLTLCLHRGLGVTFPPRSFVIERVGLPLRHFWSGHVGHLGFRVLDASTRSPAIGVATQLDVYDFQGSLKQVLTATSGTSGNLLYTLPSSANLVRNLAIASAAGAEPSFTIVDWASLAVVQTIPTIGNPASIFFSYSQNLTPSLPISLIFESPPPANITPTLWGNLHTSILDPGAALFIRDGLGLRGPPDPTMIAGTTLSQGLIVPPAILPGTVVVTQLITFDPALPFDVAIGISPPITLIL